MALFSLALSLLSSCAAQRMLTRKDYIRMSDEEIRTVFLRETPVGSTEEKVREVMREKFGLKPRKNFVVDSPAILESIKKNPDKFRAETELSDYHLYVHLAAYGWAKRLFLMGETINASWLFSKDGLLKDIRVERYTDGA